MPLSELSAAAPEIWVAIMGCIILILDVVFSKYSRTISYILCQFTLLVALYLTVQMLGAPNELAFANTFINDPISNALKIVIFIYGIFGFVYARKYLSEHRIGNEYFILCLFSILGMMALVSARSFLTLYLGIELLTLPLYALIALARDDKKAPEAAMKYFVMGAIASGMLLFGISLLYGVTGSFDIAAVAQKLGSTYTASTTSPASTPSPTSTATTSSTPIPSSMSTSVQTSTPPSSSTSIQTQTQTPMQTPTPTQKQTTSFMPTFTSTSTITPSIVVLCAMVFILSGLAFKLGAVPFHMWIPDIYQGAPTSVTLFIATLPKLAGFGMAIRILMDALPSINFSWQPILAIIAFLSIGLGNIVAIVQTNLKRLLAYSAIGNIGFVFLGLLAGPESGYSAALAYMIIYTLMALGAFGIIIALSHRGFEAENISDYQGLGSTQPIVAFLMMLLMLSLAGIPPTVGFYAKFIVLDALITAGYNWLAVAAVLFTVIGAYYYLKVIKVMYFEPQLHSMMPQPQRVSTNSAMFLSINGILVLGLGMYPTPLINFCLGVFGVQHL